MPARSALELAFGASRLFLVQGFNQTCSTHGNGQPGWPAVPIGRPVTFLPILISAISISAFDFERRTSQVTGIVYKTEGHSVG